MSEEKDILSIWKERIDAEAKHNDRTNACRNANRAYTTLQNALAKKKYDDLTTAELEVLVELIKILDARIEAAQKLQQQYAK